MVAMRLLPRLPPRLGSAQGSERGHLPIGKTSQIYAAPQPECRRGPVSVVPEAAGSCLPSVPLRVQASRRAVFAGWQLWAQPLTPLHVFAWGLLRSPAGREGRSPGAERSRLSGGGRLYSWRPCSGRGTSPARAPARGGTAAPASPSFRSLLSRTRVTGQPSVTPPAIWESTRSPRVPCLSLRES